MKTILLIDDNKDILENLTEYLEMEGYKILSATNGKNGIELAKQHIPHLILCDTLMPDLDGYEVLHLLLETCKTHKIPFVFSTSNSEKVDKTKAIELGADDYLIKPYDMETLAKVIQHWLKSGTNTNLLKR